MDGSMILAMIKDVLMDVPAVSKDDAHRYFSNECGYQINLLIFISLVHRFLFKNRMRLVRSL